LPKPQPVNIRRPLAATKEAKAIFRPWLWSLHFYYSRYCLVAEAAGEAEVGVEVLEDGPGALGWVVAHLEAVVLAEVDLGVVDLEVLEAVDSVEEVRVVNGN
jgi:hypothetical protein